MSLFDDQNKLFGNNTQTGLDARLTAMQNLRKSSDPAPSPIMAAASQPMAPRPASNVLSPEAATMQNSNAQSVIDSVMANSNLSSRQKAKMALDAGNAAAPGTSLDIGRLSGLSGRQAADFQVGQLKQNNQDIAYRDRNPQLAYEQGGKISGPGTATSDSIPAKTPQGPIRVANGERIVSVAQDQALERIAEMLGYESVDAMFEALTGKAVGPTMKGGLPAAADGAKIDPEMLMKQVASSRGLDYQAPVAAAAPTASPIKSNLQMVGEQSSNDIDSVNSVGAKIHHAAKGVLAAIPAAAVDAYDFIAPKVAPIFTGQDYQPAAQPQPAPAQAPAAAPAPVASPAPVPEQQQPGEAILTAAATPRDFTPGHPLTTKDIAPGGYIDRGAGILAQRGKNGQLNVTNVGTGELTDPNKRAMDDSASALIDQKGSTYNPGAQLQRMQSMRMQSDASNPEVTDPNVRAAAVQGMNILTAARSADTQARTGDAQNRLSKVQADSAEQLAGLHKEYLDPNTTPERRNELHNAIRAISGKERDPEYATSVVPGELGSPATFITTDKRTGKLTAAGTGPDAIKQVNAAKQPTGTPAIDAYAKAVREHPKFKGKTLTDQQIQEMYRATYPGAK